MNYFGQVIYDGKLFICPMFDDIIRPVACQLGKGGGDID
jgi:hypothetical protein